MILAVLLRPGIDKAQAEKVSLWLRELGQKDAEFYIVGDHTLADR